MSVSRTPSAFAPARRASALRLSAAFVVSAGLVASCGGSDSAGGSSAGGDDSAGGLMIEGAWARNSPMMATSGAAYMDITAEETTSIVSASVPADVAGTVEIHETVPVETDDAMEGSEDSGMDMAMTMREIDALELPAGETVSLAPGGIHVMLLDLPDALELGETFDLTLTAEDGTETVVSVEVRDEAP